MQRYFLEIAFNGSSFAGWQIQPNSITVQGEVNAAISTLLQENVMVMGCGRTDTGVHASQFYLHLDTVKEINDKFLHRLNSLLGKTIAVRKIIPVTPEQHSRFSAKKRTYHYYLHTEKNPFLEGISYQPKYKNLDIEAMHELAKGLLEINDFKVLSKFNEDVATTLCDIHVSSLLQIAHGRWVYKICANRFLWNMVRRIVGTLITVGRAKITPDKIIVALKNDQELPLNFVAPPHGLFLTHVEYPFINNECTGPNV